MCNVHGVNSVTGDIMDVVQYIHVLKKKKFTNIYEFIQCEIDGLHFSITIESKTALRPIDVSALTWKLLSLDAEFVSLQINWIPNITDSCFFIKFRLKDDDQWISTKNISIRNNSFALIRLKRNQLYEMVIVSNAHNSTLQSEIIEIYTEITGELFATTLTID